jgi:hypothetical protein
MEASNAGRVRPALNAPVERGSGAVRPGLVCLVGEMFLGPENRPVGAPVAQLFSQLMSSTGLAFCILASSLAQPHRTIGIERECRAPAEGHP